MSACPIRDRRPPTGSRTYAKLLDYPAIIWNTLLVTFAATAMALLFGFMAAWILTRTNVPFRRTLDQLMTVPYYVTPLLGALAWSFLGAPESGFVNQVWRKLGGTEALIDMTSPFGHRLGDGAVRRLGRLRDDQRRHAVHGPGAGGSLAGDGRKPLAHDVAHHAAAGHARRARAPRSSCSPKCSARSRSRSCSARRRAST